MFTGELGGKRGLPGGPDRLRRGWLRRHFGRAAALRDLPRQLGERQRGLGVKFGVGLNLRWFMLRCAEFS